MVQWLVGELVGWFASLLGSKAVGSLVSWSVAGAVWAALVQLGGHSVRLFAGLPVSWLVGGRGFCRQLRFCWLLVCSLGDLLACCSVVLLVGWFADQRWAGFLLGRFVACLGGCWFAGLLVRQFAGSPDHRLDALLACWPAGWSTCWFAGLLLSLWFAWLARCLVAGQLVCFFSGLFARWFAGEFACLSQRGSVACWFVSSAACVLPELAGLLDRLSVVCLVRWSAGLLLSWQLAWLVGWLVALLGCWLVSLMACWLVGKHACLRFLVLWLVGLLVCVFICLHQLTGLSPVVVMASDEDGR